MTETKPTGSTKHVSRRSAMMAGAAVASTLAAAGSFSSARADSAKRLVEARRLAAEFHRADVMACSCGETEQQRYDEICERAGAALRAQIDRISAMPAHALTPDDLAALAIIATALHHMEPHELKAGPHEVWDHPRNRAAFQLMAKVMEYAEGGAHA